MRRLSVFALAAALAFALASPVSAERDRLEMLRLIGRMQTPERAMTYCNNLGRFARNVRADAEAGVPLGVAMGQYTRRVSRIDPFASILSQGLDEIEMQFIRIVVQEAYRTDESPMRYSSSVFIACLDN